MSSDTPGTSNITTLWPPGKGLADATAARSARKAPHPMLTEPEVQKTVQLAARLLGYEDVSLAYRETVEGQKNVSHYYDYTFKHLRTGRSQTGFAGPNLMAAAAMVIEEMALMNERVGREWKTADKPTRGPHRGQAAQLSEPNRETAPGAETGPGE